MKKQDFLLPENISIDREIEFCDDMYRIVEFLNSNMLLVVKKEDFDNQNFPIQTYIIPGE
ncbi:hypothetical protein CPT_Mater204 [Bacillus phage Mater]|uniref:Uncharacterized protein n=1 Tax=Bacillus phage Mater TaxID=1540090 RepID=A0A0A0RS80_9CAUD|nr:hypothetical protein CPT_Mater204 [Bacillus phage Mater]AIW03361.1 hypothetical protein CPT_Mater204 [Bacillus phage Mater]